MKLNKFTHNLPLKIIVSKVEEGCKLLIEFIEEHTNLDVYCSFFSSHAIQIEAIDLKGKVYSLIELIPETADEKEHFRDDVIVWENKLENGVQMVFSSKLHLENCSIPILEYCDN